MRGTATFIALALCVGQAQASPDHIKLLEGPNAAAKLSEAERNEPVSGYLPTDQSDIAANLSAPADVTVERVGDLARLERKVRRRLELEIEPHRLRQVALPVVDADACLQAQIVDEYLVHCSQSGRRTTSGEAPISQRIGDPIPPLPWIHCRCARIDTDSTPRHS